MKTIREVMTSLPETLDPEASVGRATQIMRDGGPEAVAVVDGIGSLVGIVTDGDIAGQDADTPVRDYMTVTPDAVGPDTTLDQALTVMTSRQVRHLPVLDNGRLVGMVSIQDLGASDSLVGARGEMQENIPVGSEINPAGPALGR